MLVAPRKGTTPRQYLQLSAFHLLPLASTCSSLTLAPVAPSRVQVQLVPVVAALPLDLVAPSRVLQFPEVHSRFLCAVTVCGALAAVLQQCLQA